MVTSLYLVAALLLTVDLNERQGVPARTTLMVFALAVPAASAGARLLDVLEYWGRNRHHYRHRRLEHPEYYELREHFTRCLRGVKASLRGAMRQHDQEVASIENQRSAIVEDLRKGEEPDSSPEEEGAMADSLTTPLTSEALERVVRELRAQVRRLKRTLAYPQEGVQDEGSNRWNVRAEASLGALLLGIVVVGFDFRVGIVLLRVALYLRIGVS